jgi:uncharacterized DUF497 family protein
VKVPFEHQFEWDKAKAIRNVREHGITFKRAATVFHDPTAISIFDEEHSDDEERWITLGLDSSGSLLVVCHTFRTGVGQESRIRLISARYAERHERKQYQQKT